MINKLKQLQKAKLLIVGLVVGALVMVPLSAYANNDTTPDSEPQENELVDTEAPSVPTSLVHTGVTTNAVTVSWSAATDNVAVTGYDVRIAAGEPMTVATNSYTFSGLTADTEYLVDVRARDVAGNVSAYAAPLTVKTATTATPPTTTEDNEEETNDTATEATLQTAITIAALEHPNVEVVAARVVRLNGEKVYKVSFVDGWRVYVRASDGDTVVIKDWFNVSRPVAQKAKKAWLKNHSEWKPWSAAYSAWTKNWLKERDWNSSYHAYKGWINRDWKKLYVKPVEPPTESTEPTAPTQVRPTNTQQIYTNTHEANQPPGD